MTKPSRNALDGPIIEVRSGVSIYKVHASPFYRARIWIPSEKKRKVFSTKATSRIEAIKRAEELFESLGSQGRLNAIPVERTFQRFSEKLLNTEKKRGERGEINRRTWQVSKTYLHNGTWGLLNFFADRDVTTIQTKDYYSYISWLDERDCSLSVGTRNHVGNTFRKVMNIALQEGIITTLPPMPRAKRKDNPRSFFQFSPRVSLQEDEVKLLLDTAGKMASEHVSVRGTVITNELTDFIHFILVSFLRPTEGEIYNLRHRDIAVANDSVTRLTINVSEGKTGHRMVLTMPRAVSLYREMCRRRPGKKDDYVFWPGYSNRATAKRVVQRQFNAVLDRCGLKRDPVTGMDHTVYSLRHTAICMRLVWSGGKVNHLFLAKNAGTSVDQIERFYAKRLGLDKVAAKNLQVMGTDFIGMGDQCDYG